MPSLEAASLRDLDGITGSEKYQSYIQRSLNSHFAWLWLTNCRKWRHQSLSCKACNGCVVDESVCDLGHPGKLCFQFIIFCLKPRDLFHGVQRAPWPWHFRELLFFCLQILFLILISNFYRYFFIERLTSWRVIPPHYTLCANTDCFPVQRMLGWPVTDHLSDSSFMLRCDRFRHHRNSEAILGKPVDHRRT